MSGRGTITSRATVSPNSMMLSMSSRSSCSMTSSLAAASTMPSSSCSDDERALLEALAGQDHVGQPDQTLGDRRAAARTSPATTSGGRSPAPPARCAARPTSWGSASVNTKSTTTLSTKPTTAPHVPNRRSNRNVLSERRRRLQDVDREQHRVEEPLRLARRGASSARPRPRVVVGERLGLVPGDPVDARSRRRASRARSTSSTAGRREISASVVVNSAPSIRRTSSPIMLLAEAGGSRAAPVVPLQQLELAARASRRPRRGSAWSWPRTWSTPCTTSRASSSSSVPACAGACSAATAGQTTTSPSSTGTPARRLVVVERERQHVGRAVLAEVLAR